ncbi:LINE-1 reverse transcriptase like, partial [Trifolium medium]|nr:LINE-1 reverse transcriptase like [Trifolium medium]
MSVLVNGSPTEEINIRRGLKQGDPLAPLLFLIVAEGLGALMRMVVDRGRFKPFSVGRGGMLISILQYVDDTLCIREATVENLWAVKAVLRGFEMASAEFLNCRIDRFPFKYLGLPVGANPRLFSTWLPMLDTIRRRLGSWGNKFISLGGRIVLINAVLSAIPIFFLSYMKMPMKVWREVVRIQHNFLWGGLTKKRRISWVKWKDLCKPKKEGGLGIRNLRFVNLSLLAKWRWRLLLEEEEVWKHVIMAKYGDGALGNVTLGDTVFGNVCSAWWGDLCKLDKGDGWFNQVVTKNVGRGDSTMFWKDVWAGYQTLEQQFPRLFGISAQQHEKVANMGSWENGVWRWGLLWRRQFFVWENDLLRQLEEVLTNSTITEAVDRWVWKPNEEDGFSVKSL